MTAYKVTTPNGEVITRNSKRNYTHAAFVILENGDYSYVGFAGSYDLAIKAAKHSIFWGFAAGRKGLKAIRHRDPEAYARGMARLAENEIKALKLIPAAIEVTVEGGVA